LWKIIFRSNNCSKTQGNNFIFLDCSKSWSIKRILSSAYCMIDNPSSTRWGMAPLICPLCLLN
jgi:hypothetical protein